MKTVSAHGMTMRLERNKKKFSSKMPTIQQIQCSLKKYGYDIEVTEKMDRQTFYVMRAFQYHFTPENPMEGSQLRWFQHFGHYWKNISKVLRMIGWLDVTIINTGSSHEKILFLIPFVIFIHSVAHSKSILIKPKQILDVRSGKLINADILVESGVIKKVAKNIPIKSEYEIIDLTDMTVLPGLMDAHVHLTGNTDLKGHEGISESSYLATIYGVKNAETLMAGFTTVKMLRLLAIQMWH